MDNVFIIAGIISIVFFLAKFAEMRFIDKEPKPLKFLVRDTLLVYTCVLIGYFVLEQLKPVMKQVGGGSGGGDGVPLTPPAFTDNPGF